MCSEYGTQENDVCVPILAGGPPRKFAFLNYLVSQNYILLWNKEITTSTKKDVYDITWDNVGWYLTGKNEKLNTFWLLLLLFDFS